QPPAPSARWPHTAPTSAVECGASSGEWVCQPNLVPFPERKRAGGRRLPASSPSAPPPPRRDVASGDQPTPPQLLVETATEIAAVLDLHALDVDVDATDAAAVQRHHGLRPCLAHQSPCGTGDDAARSQSRDARRRHLEQRPLDAVAARDVANEARHG